MKHFAFYILCATLLFTAGCGKEQPRLYLYTWADYISPAVIADFERAHNCRVSLDTFDSNETMYAKIKAGGARYDIIMPSSYYLQILDEHNLLSPLDISAMPNVAANLDKRFTPDKDKPTYGKHVPYAASYVGIGCDKRVLGNLEPSWALVTNAVFKKRTTVFNDMRHTLGAALKALGYSLNSVDPKELAEARDLVIQWKRNIAKFENEQYKTGLASGEFLLAVAYNADIIQLQEDNRNIVFVYPKEGFEMMTDDFVIPSNARNKELAQAFINFCYDPKHAKVNMERMGCLCPVTGAYPLLTPEVRNNPAIFPPDEILALGEYTQDIGTNLYLYAAAWDKVKSTD